LSQLNIDHREIPILEFCVCLARFAQPGQKWSGFCFAHGLLIPAASWRTASARVCGPNRQNARWHPGVTVFALQEKDGHAPLRLAAYDKARCLINLTHRERSRA
jgi:hypothetical protein